MSYPCHACDVAPFESPSALALHILSEPRRTHKKGRVWASTVLAKVKEKRAFKPRQALSDELKETIKNCVRELSGEIKKGMVKCPSCRQSFIAELEIEFIENPISWRDSQNYLLVNCPNCRRKK